MFENNEGSGELVQVSPLYPNDDVLRIYGEIAFLCFHSKLYQKWSMQAIAKVFEAPIYLKQFQVYRAKDVPRGVVTWGLLSADCERKYLSGEGLDEFDQWNSGEQLWIMDIMAPWGHGKEIIKNIKDTVPVDSVKTIREHKNRRMVLEWYRASGTKKWQSRTTSLD